MKGESDGQRVMTHSRRERLARVADVRRERRVPEFMRQGELEAGSGAGQGAR